MLYAISDLHGCYEKYVKMLEKIRFEKSDTLYILGDVVDRGSGGINILLDMMHKDNIIPIMGNHDYTACTLLKAFGQNDAKSSREKLRDVFELWLYDGGEPTYTAYRKLNTKQQEKVLAYLRSFLLYDEVRAGDRNYFLAHTVPEKARMLNFDTLFWQEFIIGEPEYDKVYYKNKIIVTGHTPTKLIDRSYNGRIFKRNNHLAIDCGAVYGGSLAAVCLNTLEEFYI